MAKRGRVKRTPAEIRDSFRSVTNGFQLQGLELLIVPETGRVGVYERTGDGELSAVVAGVSGNTFIDICKGMLALGWRASGLPGNAGMDKPEAVDLSATEE